MEKFLEKLAQHVHDTFGDHTRDLCVVLPNRRAGLFIKRHLAAIYRRNLWAPAVYAIEDYIMEHTPFRQAEPAVLLFELYDVHRQLAGEESQSFEDIMAWGPILLEDLNETDLYLGDAEKIFTYLEEEKALLLWHPDGSPLTEMEKKYLSFFRSLKDYYHLLKERLAGKNLAYQGMAYRYFHDHLEEIVPRLTWKQTLFAGFNALTLAEEKIIRGLRDKGVAGVLWDADRYYLEDKDQEAGEFLRTYLSTWSGGDRRWVGEDLLKGRKTIHVTGVAGNVGQAKYAGQLLSGPDAGKGRPEDTAVVLADESLLVPMLNSLPAAYSDVNITMGYPLPMTPLYLFMQSVISMQENMEKKALSKKGTKQFYSRDLLRVISHPYFRLLCGQDESVMSDVKAGLIASRKIFYSGKETREVMGRLTEKERLALFTPWNDAREGLESIASVIESLRDRFISQKENDRRLDTEYLFHYAKLVRKVRDLCREYEGVDSIRSLRKLMETLSRGSKIPFTGEPLKGLQVMGVLETRTLDFDTVILLSANENIIPAPRNYQSFIPFEIKRHFGLPTFRDKDAIYAYHFYRMIQKATNIHILYNTEPDTLSGGERSRFITQLLYELPKANPQAVVKEQILHAPPMAENLVPDFNVPKTKDVIAALYEMAHHGFSPSSLAAYINCPLQFFLRSVAGLEEEEELEETVDAATLGSVVHSALQRLYEDAGGQRITAEDLKNMSGKVPSYVDDAFREHYEGGDLSHGKNLLINRVAILFTKNFIESEIRALERTGQPMEILMLERSLEYLLSIDEGGSPLEVKIRGKIDRVDRTDGLLRIIDYKTGFVKEGDLKVKNWQDVTTDPAYSKAFQLMTYALMYRETVAAVADLPGIVSLRAPGNGFMQVSAPEDDPDKSIDSFREVLKDLIGEIFDPSVSFSQTEDTERCRYCPFTGLCQR